MGPWQTLGLYVGYAGAIGATRLMAMTLVTYLLIFSDGKLQDISDVIHSNELVIAGIGAFLFWSVTRGAGRPPLASHRRGVAVGLLWGAETAVAVIAAFWISGYLQLTGVYSPPENAAWAYGGALTRLVCLAFLLCVDEWFFRGLLQPALARLMRPGVAVVATAFLCLAPKVIQLDLGWRQSGTLLLLYLWMGLAVLRGKPFVRGAAFLFSMLFVWHFLCGLPILGLETVLTQVFQVPRTATGTMVGATGDPLASPAVTALALGAVLLEISRFKKNLWTRLSLS